MPYVRRVNYSRRRRTVRPVRRRVVRMPLAMRRVRRSRVRTSVRGRRRR